MEKSDLNKLKLNLSLTSKNGLDFIISATITWFIIAYIWTLSFSSYDKSIFTFMVGSLMLPFALLMSKILKTKWKNNQNPISTLGLWLNFAQLFYFPFLVFILLKQPDYFLMTYVIITGAHFFPYAWFYDEKGYAVMAGVISVGALLVSLNVEPEKMYLVGVFIGVCLAVLAIWLYLSYKKKKEDSL